jgi:hypothetical protein
MLVVIGGIDHDVVIVTAVPPLTVTMAVVKVEVDPPLVIGMVVVVVMVSPPVMDKRVVVTEGHEMVVMVASVYGGKTSVHGGLHFTCGSLVYQIDGGT